MLQAWWASLAPPERTAACSDLQFALRQELTRREGVRRAARGGSAPSVASGPRKLVEEL